MRKVRVLGHHIQTRLAFHAERLRLISSKYPRQILQRRVDSSGVWFEVHNITEANRVRFLDAEEAFIRQMLDELTMEDIFYDVGACIGVFSLHAARRCKQVLAFEPEPGFRQHLVRNVQINGFQNVMVLPYAVADRSVSFPLYTDGTDGKSPSLEDDGFKNKIEVEARALSDLVFQDGVLAPSIIKMDIEGGEILALKGMKELFARNPPRSIYLELHPVLLAHFNSSVSEVFSLLQAAGYKVRKQITRNQQVHYVFELR